MSGGAKQNCEPAGWTAYSVEIEVQVQISSRRASAVLWHLALSTLVWNIRSLQAVWFVSIFLEIGGGRS
ncbi:hypothetical protein B5U98_08735 [Bosea sp. Tri-39]|nr:hypothetical protein BLM15_21945 [Bosea sp. Tri-49]RXT22733.1 hypothetical protein B5U98_08735 [Bosea sp. Tri-39]RXT38202.1 hypothetical protein B5U99_08185 [Bosea sp. Tri-54]